MALRCRHQGHARRCQALHESGETAAAGDGGVAQLLQPLPRRGDAGAQACLDLAPARRAARRLDGGAQLLQAEVAFDGAHDAFLAPVVVAVAGHAAIAADAVDQQVHVLMPGVGMARQQVLVVVQAHARQIAARDLCPLGVGQLLSRRGRQRYVQHRLAQARAQLAHGAEFLRQFARRAAGHVGVDHARLLLAQVIRQHAAKAASLDGLSDHRPAP
nr:hypothetical protein [Janthinobacterium sp. FT14W]